MSKDPKTQSIADPLVKEMAGKVWAQAQNVADQPYQAYGGKLVAGLNPDQNQAYDLIRQGVNNNVGGAALGQAGQALSNVANYAPQQVAAPNLGLAGTGAQYMGAYQNPWTNDVVNSTLSDLDRSRQMAIGQGEDAASRAGAYGGSRHGVADSLTNEASLRAAASAAGNLRSQGFNTAAGLGAADAAAANQYGLQQGNMNLQAGLANQGAGLTAANLGLSAGNALSNLSEQQRNQLLQNSAALEAAGGARQKDEQNQLNSAYQQWQLQQQHGQEQLRTLLAPLGLAGQLGTAQTPSDAAKVGQGINVAGGLLSLFGG